MIYYYTKKNRNSNIELLRIIAALFGIVLRLKENTAISIIGGADGPTSIYVAGKISNIPVTISVVLGIVLLVIGVFVMIRNYKKK